VRVNVDVAGGEFVDGHPPSLETMDA
jgi:hypothetical protein